MCVLELGVRRRELGDRREEGREEGKERRRERRGGGGGEERGRISTQLGSVRWAWPRGGVHTPGSKCVQMAAEAEAQTVSPHSCEIPSELKKWQKVT